MPGEGKDEEEGESIARVRVLRPPGARKAASPNTGTWKERFSRPLSPTGKLCSVARRCPDSLPGSRQLPHVGYRKSDADQDSWPSPINKNWPEARQGIEASLYWGPCCRRRGVRTNDIFPWCLLPECEFWVEWIFFVWPMALGFRSVPTGWSYVCPSNFMSSRLVDMLNFQCMVPASYEWFWIWIHSRKWYQFGILISVRWHFNI